MSKRGETITLSLSAEEKERLEKIALYFGKKWGNKPNLSELIRAIANEQLTVIWGSEEFKLTTHQRNEIFKLVLIIDEEVEKLKLAIETDGTSDNKTD